MATAAQLLEATSSASEQRADEQEAAEQEGLFRTREVVEVLGVTRRQLQYWAQTGLVSPSVKTPGGHRRYTFSDLVALKATKRLIDAGVSVQRIRKSVESLRSALPQVERPLEELVLVATGDVLLVFHGDTAFEAISGQEWVFEVAEFQREIQAWKRACGVSGARPVRRTRRAERRAG